MIKKKPRKRKPETISSLKKRAWTAFSKWIRNRDGNTCFTCGKYASGRSLHAGHFVSRRHNNTLFDENNVRSQCAYCNLYLAGNVPEYALRLEKIEKGLVEKLVKKSKVIKQFTKQELLDIIDRYTIK